MTIGNRVYLKRDLPDKELVKRFSVLPAANVGDCMYRSSALSSEIKLMSSPKNKMCGVALTVKSRPGDNLMLHQALNIAQEGDVIILSNNGDRTQAIMGEIMYKYLADFKKVSGIVIDGPIRDIDVISKSSCPIYATGTTPGGPYKEGPGEVNVPISIGGIAVNPGDIILGDKDGVIVIPKNDAVDLIDKAEANAKQDHAKVVKASEGTANREWVNKTLEKKGVQIIDDVYRV
ncbi:RraA family protein [Clostridioides sp. ES-S-0190-01]|uniref:RraA family protein n=1 Tax=Clostridioides sp. ES-S-0190-01 TaxID=2770787 RepID=UPI001D0F70CF|nr:RraA family protein [Clostridioides sp. ES-S-0190-01]